MINYEITSKKKHDDEPQTPNFVQQLNDLLGPELAKQVIDQRVKTNFAEQTEKMRKIAKQILTAIFRGIPADYLVNTSTADTLLRHINVTEEQCISNSQYEYAMYILLEELAEKVAQIILQPLREKKSTDQKKNTTSVPSNSKKYLEKALVRFMFGRRDIAKKALLAYSAGTPNSIKLSEIFSDQNLTEFFSFVDGDSFEAEVTEQKVTNIRVDNLRIPLNTGLGKQLNPNQRLFPNVLPNQRAVFRQQRSKKDVRSVINRLGDSKRSLTVQDYDGDVFGTKLRGMSSEQDVVSSEKYLLEQKKQLEDALANKHVLEEMKKTEHLTSPKEIAAKEIYSIDLLSPAYLALVASNRAVLSALNGLFADNRGYNNRQPHGEFFWLDSEDIANEPLKEVSKGMMTILNTSKEIGDIYKNFVETDGTSRNKEDIKRIKDQVDQAVENTALAIVKLQAIPSENNSPQRNKIIGNITSWLEKLKIYQNQMSLVVNNIDEISATVEDVLGHSARIRMKMHDLFTGTIDLATKRLSEKPEVSDLGDDGERKTHTVEELLRSTRKDSS